MHQPDFCDSSFLVQIHIQKKEKILIEDDGV